jgi:hypothetical protein
MIQYTDLGKSDIVKHFKDMSIMIPEIDVISDNNNLQQVKPLHRPSSALLCMGVEYSYCGSQPITGVVQMSVALALINDAYSQQAFHRLMCSSEIIHLK